MKKFLLIILFVTVLICSSCSKTDPGAPAAPNAIYFQSFEAYNTFSSVDSLSESDFSSFVMSPAFCNEVIKTKDDCIELFNMLSSQKIPVIEGFKISTFGYYPDSNSYYLHYAGDDETVTFKMSLKDTKTSESYRKNIKPYVGQKVCEDSKNNMSIYSLNAGYSLENGKSCYPFVIELNDNYAVFKVFSDSKKSAKQIAESQLTFDNINKILLNESCWGKKE